MVEENGRTLGEYTYNGLGQRIIKVESGVITTVFHYDFDGNIIGESDLDGNFTKEYLYRGSGRLALVDVATEEIYFYGNDRLGTPQILTDSTNTVVWEGYYKPFGEAEVNPNSSIVNNFRFPGQYYDAETGLHYNYHRYYDPGTGRYLRPDPIGLVGGINLFTYLENNPLNKTDPFGLQAAAIGFGGTAVPVGVTQPQNKRLQEAYKQVAKDIPDYAKDSVIDSLTYYSLVAGAISPIQREKVTDYEGEKNKLTTKNTQVEVKYGGHCETPLPEPDDECKRLAKSIQSPQFKKLPLIVQALSILMYSVSCR